MVVHETYRRPNTMPVQWLLPTEIQLEGEGESRHATEIATGKPAEIGSIEKMSKSKKNLVDPDDIIAAYGADCARWFVLSDSPPDRDVIWTEAGVSGANRFIQRIWRLTEEIADGKGCKKGEMQPVAFSDEAVSLRQAVHKALAAVGQNIEGLRFNVAVAQIYEATNALSAAVAKARWLRRPRLGNPGGDRTACPDDRADDAAPGRTMLGAAWIQHPGGRSGLAGCGGGLAGR